MTTLEFPRPFRRPVRFRPDLCPFRALLGLALVLAPLGAAGAAPLRLDSGILEPTPQNGIALGDLLRGDDPAVAGRHVLVQLDRIPAADERSDLAARGLRLLHYVPDRGYLAWIAPEATLDPAVRARVQWSAPIPIRDKTSEMLRTGVTPEYAVADDGRIRIVAKHFADVAEPDARRALESAGVELVGSLPVFHRFEGLVPAAAIPDVARLDAVRWIDLVPPPPVDDVDDARVDQQAEDAQAAPYGLSGVGVDVGEIDSGNPDSNHDDLQGRITDLQNLNTSTHSTHVAGIVMGDGTLSETEGGTALQWRGMAPAADIVSWGSGGSYLSRYAAAIGTHDIEMATNSWGWGVGSSNCSLYGDYGSDAPEHDMIIAGLHGKRIPIFFSAGNERDDCDCGMSCSSPFLNYTNIRPPGATAKNTMTVGAKYSNSGVVTTFSSWGPMDDGRLKPELVASGDQQGGDGAITATIPGDTYGALAGTSMSTPAAAGCAALLVEDFRALTGSDPLPSTIKAHFIHTAKDLKNVAVSYLTPGPDFASGYGVLKVRRAIDQLRTGDWVEDSVDQGQSDLYVVGVPNDATVFRASLAWDDEAGAENADPALVNDLDLVVTDADGVRRYPWTLDPANPADPAVQTQEDHLNVIEQVFVDTGVAPGDWTVEVRGTTVPLGPQLYSLVFTHDGSTPTGAPESVGPFGLRTATLHPSHPNPFSPWTAISYSLKSPAPVSLRVLDVRGRVVRTLVAEQNQAEGEYVYTWRGRDDRGRMAGSGVYLVELRAGTERTTSKVTLLR